MDEGTLIHHHFLAACLVTRLRQPIKINKLSAASLETTQSPLMDDIFSFEKEATVVANRKDHFIYF